jgi:hypothetical protein
MQARGWQGQTGGQLTSQLLSDGDRIVAPLVRSFALPLVEGIARRPTPRCSPGKAPGPSADPAGVRKVGACLAPPECARMEEALPGPPGRFPSRTRDR